jgi:hypothetical protein
MFDPISAGISAVAGIGQMVAGKSQKNKAEKMMPDLFDANQVDLFNDIERKRKGYYNGSAVQSALLKARETTSALKEGIVASAGSDSGSALTALSRASKNASAGFNDVLGTAEQRGQFFTTASMQLANRIENRKIQLSLYERSKMLGNAEELIGGATDNLLGGAAGLSGLAAPAIAKKMQALFDNPGEEAVEGEEAGLGDFDTFDATSGSVSV